MTNATLTSIARVCDALNPRRDVEMLTIPRSEALGQIALVIDNRIAFAQRVVDLLADGRRHFVIDCREATYMDSTGLGVLMSSAKKVRAVGGSLVILGLNEDLATLFSLTKLDTVLDVRTVPEWIRDGGAL